jgi:hypothetical protein
MKDKFYFLVFICNLKEVFAFGFNEWNEGAVC